MRFALLYRMLYETALPLVLVQPGIEPEPTTPKSGTQPSKLVSKLTGEVEWISE